jgi:hypothetical protein
MRAKFVLRALLLSSPMMLSGCGAIDQSSIDLPWQNSAPLTATATAVALRGDAGDLGQAPDGMQREDLQAPFGAPESGVTPAERGSL